MFNGNQIEFIVNKKKLENNCNLYKKIANVYYPLKTNSTSQVLKILNSCGCNFLISSINHLNLIEKNNISINKVCSMNVLAQIETLKHFYNKGVRSFTFDNLELLKKFCDFASLQNTQIVLRISSMVIRPNIVNHMGATLSEVIKMISFLKEQNANNYGLSFYLNHQVSKNKKNIIKKMLCFIEKKLYNCGIKFINVAGINEDTKYLSKILLDFKKKIKIDCVNLEIGRMIVNDCIDLKTRIIDVKNINKKQFVVIQNGIYTGFLDKIIFNKKYEMMLLMNENSFEIRYKKYKIK